MARKRSNDNHEIFPGDDDELTPAFDAHESEGAEDGLDNRDNRNDLGDIEDNKDQETSAEDDSEAATLPTASDLESHGFTPEEVRRLVVVSDRQAQSTESQLAEATLRRLRFTRWLVEHGMLDEWSA